jgi:hypothetical protein
LNTLSSRVAAVVEAYKVVAVALEGFVPAQAYL